MWPEEERFDVERGRGSNGSDVVILGEQAVPAEVVPRPGRPYFVNTMNISTSPGARVGDNYVNVTNVHHTDEVVHTRFLGLELISPAHARRLRCSVAVFVCWALFFASGLAIYFFNFALSTKYRIDIDLSCGKYTWAYVKNSTCAERVCCSLSMVLLATFMALAVYLSIFYNTNPISPDDEDWYVSRESWLGDPYDNVDIPSGYEPLRLVIIQHSSSGDCRTSQECKIYVRNLQRWFINERDRDIPYNFLIGNDGRVYEGRGWHKEGAFLIGYNKCSVGIGFIGDYRTTKPADSQEKGLNKILDMGVKLGYLHPEYKVGAAIDYQNEPDYVSPGPNLIEAMQHWPHYDHDGRFIKKNCSQITTMPFP